MPVAGLRSQVSGFREIRFNMRLSFGAINRQWSAISRQRVTTNDRMSTSFVLLFAYCSLPLVIWFLSFDFLFFVFSPVSDFGFLFGISIFRNHLCRVFGWRRGVIKREVRCKSGAIPVAVRFVSCQ